MNKGLIIFDFDGTLGDTRRNIVKTMQMTIDELHLPNRVEEECASTIGLPLTVCFETLFPHLHKEEIQQCADTYRRIFAENLQSMTPQPFPGVIQTLKTLKHQGYVLTIASSRSHVSLVELSHDILMGANAGAKTCGVTWGNGRREELEQAGADYIIDRMEELLHIIHYHG